MIIRALRGTEVRTTSPVSASDQDVLLAAKGGMIAFIGNLVASASRFAFGVVIARLLGAELLGMYSLSLTVTQIVGGLALLGLSAGMARYIPIAVNEDDDAFLWGIIQIGIGIPIVIALALTLGVFLLAEPLSLWAFGQPDLAPVLRLASLAIPFTALISLLGSITQGFKRMEYKVYAQDIALNLSKFALSVVLIVVGLSVMGALAAHILASALTVAMLFYYVHHLFSLNRPLHTAKRRTREILHFSLPIYLSGLVSDVSGSTETVILGMIGVMSGVGVYASALRLSGVGNMFFTSLQRISIPMISDLYSQGKLDQLQRVYQTITKWAITFNLPIFLATVIFAGPLLSIFGKDFVVGAPGLAILAFGSMFNASTGTNGSMITMTGHSKVTLVNSITNLVVSLTLDVLLIPRWGIVGAALAVTLTGVLVNILRTIQVYFFLRLWPYNWSFLKPITAALLAGGATYFVNQWLTLRPMALKVAVGMALLGSIYALVILLLRLSAEDRLVLDRVWARVSRWRPQS